MREDGKGSRGRILRGKLVLLQGTHAFIFHRITAQNIHTRRLLCVTQERRSASVRALTHCDLFVLTRERWEGVIVAYPRYEDRLKEVAFF